MKNLLFNSIYLLSFLLYGQLTMATPTHQPKLISVNFNQIDLKDALRIVAHLGEQNCIISPNIKGTITLNMQATTAKQIFDVILRSHQLEKISQENSWLVLSENEWLQRQQEIKLREEVKTETEPLLIHIWQIHYTKAEDIVHLLEDRSLLSKRGYIHFDAHNNRIAIRARSKKIIEIGKLIRQLDIPTPQILIKARLASVDSNYEYALGIHLKANQNPQPDNNGVSLTRLLSASRLDIELAALEEQGHGEIISNPSLFTANHQEASIEAGEEIPYQEVSRSGGTSVTFKKAVLSLKVTPEILPNHWILLQLQVNQDKPSRRMILGVPSISTRQISTSILVKDGETVVLGGIFETDKDYQTASVPYLGKIPLVGWLFQQQNIAENKRELLIFVTPKIIG